MKNAIRIVSWASVIVLIMGATSCNLPFFNPGGSDDNHVPTNPDAPSNTDGAETILIPAGTFWMGSEDDDAQAEDDETPRHQVTLNGFYLYTHEVTNAMYAACVAAGGCSEVNALESGPTSHHADPEYAEHPVVGVDWNMAEDYCTWAGGRLPTEAEWERAARGGDSLIFPWGSEDAGCDRTNLLGCFVPPNTVEIGNYLLGNSPEGVWDMAGNVWEWVNDWYDADTYFFSTSWNPLGPFAPEDPDRPLKVVRGGGLYSEPQQLRGAARTGINPYRAYDDVGFRCVAEGSGIPSGYVPADDRHERVPPEEPDGGGETADDPDDLNPPWWIEEYFIRVSCPDDEGNIRVTMGVDTEPGTRIDLTVTGSPDSWFECSYDEGMDLLECEGAAPPDFDSRETVVVYYRAWPPGTISFYGYAREVPVPDDCDSIPPGPARFSVALDCPEDGLFTVSFFYEPAITWETVRISGVDIPCVQISDFEMRCTAPDVRVGDHYEFYLRGTDSRGAEYEWMPWVPVRTDCLPGVYYLTAEPFCFEGHPTVQIMRSDGAPHIEEVIVDGTILECIGMAPTVLICGDLTQPPGTEVDIEINYEIGSSIHTITVPACTEEDVIAGYIEPYCYPPEAAEPAASIHYWPFDQHIVSAMAGDSDIHCSDWGGGWYVCPGIPGAVGTSIDITACLESGTCFSSPITIPDCGEILEGGWRMSSIGCHDATHIYFQIDTSLEWLIPGADFTYSASDGETTYTCTVNPAVTGRVYCAGIRPEVPGPLEFCIQRTGDTSPTCQTYPNYNMWVGGIPPCGPPEEPEEPDEPHVPSCADYTDPYTCGAEHKGECVWIYTEPQHCEDAP